MKKRSKTLLMRLVIGLLVWVMGPGAAFCSAPCPPLKVSKSAWRPLYDSFDRRLQAELEDALKMESSWRSLIRKEKMAVGLVDLADPADPRFARVNGRTMMYAASLPKIAVLLAAFVSFEDRTLKETAKIHEDLVAMMRWSSNTAATRMIDRIGFRKIEAVLRDPRFELYDENQGGGLWVGKRYAKTGRRYPDPMKGLSHAATVTQACRFYYLLATGRIISPARSRQMLEALSEPGINHKFVHSLQELAPEARLYRKSGTWRRWHSDSVLVWGEAWRKYILVCMVESRDGEQILRELVPVVEHILHP